MCELWTFQMSNDSIDIKQRRWIMNDFFKFMKKENKLNWTVDTNKSLFLLLIIFKTRISKIEEEENKNKTGEARWNRRDKSVGNEN